jgi:perosamine synthetase
MAEESLPLDTAGNILPSNSSTSLDWPSFRALSGLTDVDIRRNAGCLAVRPRDMGFEADTRSGTDQIHRTSAKPAARHARFVDAWTGGLRSGRLSLGRKLEEFESAVAAYCGAAFAAAVSSGTAALHLAIRALDIKEGDEVILPSFAFIAAANVLRYERVSPVFVDIDSRTLNLDVKRIEEAITSRTRPILVVHTFGVPAAMYEIMEIARRRGLLVVEDACEALGAQLGGKKVGTFGDIGVFSFYPNKQITTAEGGVLVTQNPAIAARVRSLRNQGRSASAERFEHTELGYNYRLSELHCAWRGVTQQHRGDPRVP